MTPHLQRKCAVCGRRENKADLFRFIYREGRIQWDSSQRMGGRGVYCHSTVACVMGLKKPHMLERALRLGKGECIKEGFQAVIQAVVNEVLNRISPE